MTWRLNGGRRCWHESSGWEMRKKTLVQSKSREDRREKAMGKEMIAGEKCPASSIHSSGRRARGRFGRLDVPDSRAFTTEGVDK